MRIELRIDELLLDGFAGADAPRIGAAVERELGRLVADGGLPSRLRLGAPIGHVTGRETSLGGDAGGDAIGSAIARAVYAGLTR